MKLTAKQLAAKAGLTKAKQLAIKGMEEASVVNTLDLRGVNYGDFTDHSIISQRLKDVMWNTPGWLGLTPNKKEALEMVAHKIARILNGNPDYRDSWHDIQGYAKLAEDRCDD